MDTDAIRLNPADGLARRLEEAAGQPVIIEHNGVRYRIEPEDPFAFYDPEKMQAAIHASAGAFKGIDVDQFLADIREARGHGPETDAEHREVFRRIVREAKPAKQPTEYGPESRYGGLGLMSHPVSMQSGLATKHRPFLHVAMTLLKRCKGNYRVVASEKEQESCHR